MALRWEQTPAGVWVVLDEHRSVLAFSAEAQKNGKAQTVPMAPELVQMLETIRKSEGYVFELPGSNREKTEVSRRISFFGDVADIITDAEKSRTATAHDLRRSFGTRWAKLLMPAESNALMRHSSITTTMQHHVGQDAADTSASLRGKLGDTCPNAAALAG